MRKYGLSALAAAGLFVGGFATSASAADLGGDCCSDLEERVAELEATTARKGNRKVSLTVSGFINEQVMYWDDGVEQNVYQIGGGVTGLASNFKFSGKAAITSDVSAGFVLQIEVGTADSLTLNGNNDDTGILNVGSGSSLNGTQLSAISSSGMTLNLSYWYLKSNKYGKLSIGQQNHATDNTAILVDGSGTLVQANWVTYEANGFAIRNNGGVALTWGGAGSCRGFGGVAGDCNGAPSNSIRYDSPTFGGFSMSTSWGEDDFWDIAARWAGEVRDFKLAFAVGYSETTEHFNLGNVVPNPAAAGTVFPNTLEYFQLGVYAQHVPTGLFVLYNYGILDEDQDAEGGRTPPPDTNTHYVKAGVRTKISPLGHTIFYGEYMHNDGSALIGTNQNGQAVTESDMDRWGLGIVQEIDAAAMSMWIKYRNHSYDDNTNVNYQDFDYVAVGAMINF